MKAPELVSKVLLKMADHVRPGITTFTLDAIAAAELKKLGGFPYNKGYHPKWARFPYPAVTCLSVNDQIAHGIPSQRVLKEGDIVTLDLGVIDEDGNAGDSAMTVPVGEISKEDKLLLHYAKAVLYAGIKKVKAGVTVRQIARAMEQKAAERKFVINRQLGGHGIGKKMHEEPTIYHVTNNYAHISEEKYNEYEKFMDIELEAGKTYCLEPMVTFADPWGVIDPDTGWEFRTKDHRNCAMFEHMVKCLDDGYEILTTHIQPFQVS